MEASRKVVESRLDGAFLSVVDQTTNWSERRELRPEALEDLQACSDRNRKLTEVRNDRQLGDSLTQIGRQLYVWLNGKQGWLDRQRPKGPRPLVLEVQGPLTPSAEEWTLLHAPWELGT